MRKILLGTTAVIGAALLAPTGAFAQDGGGGARVSPLVNPNAPDGASYGRTGGPALQPGDITVRVGGYFAAWYSHVTQSNPNSTNALVAVNGNSSNGSSVGTNTASPQTTNGSAKTGKNDFSSDAEIHIYVDGKSANGLRYGAVLELSFNGNEGTGVASGARTYALKTAGFIDEYYAYAAFPGLGQIRFGDEDGAFGLMATGVVTGFGTGGVYGSWQNNVIRPNRTTTSPGDLGDNTKIIYLSPQLYGFDFGASLALNSNGGANNGCNLSYATFSCDRTYAYTGATGNRIQPYSDVPQRRLENQVVLRYRTEIAGVGLAAHFAHIGWSAIRDMTVSGTVVSTLRPGNVWSAGLQASAYGFTLGGNFQWGQANYFWGSQERGDQNMWQWNVGATYTTGPFTIGSNAFWGNYAGANGFTFNQTTGAYAKATTAATNAQRRSGIAVGANYRLAPGMDLVAEYVRHRVFEKGNNIPGSASGDGVASSLGSGPGVDRLRADVILVGTRIAF